MGIAELTTLIFVTLKLTGVITWSWWLVLLPEIVAVVWYAVVMCVWLRLMYTTIEGWAKIGDKL